ncbi:MAG: chromosome partitioning protein [Treponema sp.]|jgi:phage shock protein A|nr:chromosome partitioning protein [Treponema sp.]
MPEMEQRPENLAGMKASDAQEYIARFITTIKLTDKKREELEVEIAKWRGRAELAHSKSLPDLAAEAEKQAEVLEAQRQGLIAESTELRRQVEIMRRQLPGLAARERSIDPDLLEQELLMAAGRMPGDEEKAATERKFAEMEKQSSADSALAELKARMGIKAGD